ncbi:MAG: TolC family protein, partial [Vampirovibrionales bacterium]
APKKQTYKVTPRPQTPQKAVAQGVNLTKKAKLQLKKNQAPQWVHASSQVPSTIFSLLSQALPSIPALNSPSAKSYPKTSVTRHTTKSSGIVLYRKADPNTHSLQAIQTRVISKTKSRKSMPQGRLTSVKGRHTHTLPTKVKVVASTQTNRASASQRYQEITIHHPKNPSIPAMVTPKVQPASSGIASLPDKIADHITAFAAQIAQSEQAHAIGLSDPSPVSVSAQGLRPHTDTSSNARLAPKRVRVLRATKTETSFVGDLSPKVIASRVKPKISKSKQPEVKGTPSHTRKEHTTHTKGFSRRLQSVQHKPTPYVSPTHLTQTTQEALEIQTEGAARKTTPLNETQAYKEVSLYEALSASEEKPSQGRLPQPTTDKMGRETLVSQNQSTNTSVTENTRTLQTLSFQGAVYQSEMQALGLKIQALEMQEAEQDVKGARSEYLPQLSVQGNTEYLHALDGTNRPVTSLGTGVIPAGTRFQTGTTLSSQYMLFDFGGRSHRFQGAKKVLEGKLHELAQEKRNLHNQITEAYAKAYESWYDWQSQTTLAPLYEAQLMLADRLMAAGVQSRLQYTDVQLGYQKYKMGVLERFKVYSEALEKLSSLTRVKYIPEETQLTPLEALPVDFAELTFDYTKTPDFQANQAGIQAKLHEYESKRRQKYPVVSAYGVYNLLGFDETNIMTTLDTFRQRAVQVGVSARVSLFDGGKLKSDVEKLRLEVERLKLEDEKRKRQLEDTDYAYLQDAFIASQTLSQSSESLKLETLKLSDIERLTVQELIQESQLVQQKLSHAQQAINYTKNELSLRSVAYKRYVLVNNGLDTLWKKDVTSTPNPQHSIPSLQTNPSASVPKSS